MRFADSRDSGSLILSHFSLLLGLAAPLWLSGATRGGELCGAARGSSGAALVYEWMWRLLGHDTFSHSDATEADLCPARGDMPMQAALVPFAGLITLGLGDTAASVIGVYFGKHKLCHGCSKTFEGTAALMSIVMIISAAAVRTCFGNAGYASPTGFAEWFGHILAPMLAALLEATTAQMDNAFVPLHYMALIFVTGK